MARHERSLRSMYVTQDLARFPLFKGGFINFGYWRSAASDPDAEDRAEASRRLYVEVLRAARIGAKTDVLEVGCGRGYGCRLARRVFRARSVIGLDLFEAQLRRARRLQRGVAGLRFVRGAAERLPFPDRSFDRVVSLEAAQHFGSVRGFVKEAFRALRPGGRLVVCTFFATRSSSLARLRAALPTVASGLDRITSSREICRAMEEAGFRSLTSRSLGAKVFPGWHAWIERCGFGRSWSGRWLRSWERGWLDYLLITARR